MGAANVINEFRLPTVKTVENHRGKCPCVVSLKMWVK